MSGFFNALIAFFTNILTWCLDGVIWLLKSVLFFIFDGIMTTISGIFTAIDVSSWVVSYGLQWTSLPPQLLYIITALQLAQCFTILSAAIVIRMIINLLPAAVTRI